MQGEIQMGGSLVPDQVGRGQLGARWGAARTKWG